MLRHAQSWVQAPLTLVDIWSATHRSKRLDCHADLQTASRGYTRSESEDHTDEKAHKSGIHPGIDTGGSRQENSKTGVSKTQPLQKRYITRNERKYAKYDLAIDEWALPFEAFYE